MSNVSSSCVKADWAAIRRCYRAVMEAAGGAGPIDAPWQDFVAVCRASEASPPLHFAVLLDQVRAYAGTRPRGAIRILDHGCGGGLSLFYLAALGFDDIHGVDIGVPRDAHNRIAREALGHGEPRFHDYDGLALPLADASVDIVYSQQVLEHVRDDVLAAYYREEARVLKPGGWALHQVPHRLVPYDSHTRTWCLHWLPRPWHRRLGRLIGKPLPDYVILRWPWQHARWLRRTIGDCEDLTLQRLTRKTDLDGYHGSRRLRRLLSASLKAPVIGPLARLVIPRLVMMETRSVRR